MKLILSYQQSGRHLRIFLFLVSLFIISCCEVIESRSQEITKSGGGDYSPERIILNLTEDPAVSQAVTWRTRASVSRPLAEIALATESPDFEKRSCILPASTEIVRLSGVNIVNHHSVIFTSLRPDTIYAYRVGDGKHWSEWNQFRTSCKNHEPFKFVNLGDPQEGVRSLCSRIFRAAYTKIPDADFWHFTGDLVDNGDNDEEWAELFDAMGWIPRMTPMIFLPGNHAYPFRRSIKKDKEYRLFHLWRPHFTLPENGPDTLKETVYFIDYQGVRLVMLNGNERLEEQAKWLDHTLSVNPQPWTIAAIHQPLYSTRRRGHDKLLQDLFVPVFDKYAVDLVLQGHDHAYARTYKLRNGNKVTGKEKGTVYVISVCGPKSYLISQRNKHLMVKLGTGRQLFQVISVEGNRLRYEVFNALGELFDSFELEK
jgi:predicted MPP superfamily phosphohydrolase